MRHRPDRQPRPRHASRRELPGHRVAPARVAPGAQGSGYQVGVSGRGYLAEHPERTSGPPVQFVGMIGRVMCDARAASWKMVWVATIASSSTSLPIGSPLFKLRSKCGKLLLEMSTRTRWPALNSMAVCHRSIVYVLTLPGVGRSGVVSSLR